jgi:hypothetical protein
VAAKRLPVLIQARMRRIGTAHSAFSSLGTNFSLKEKKQFFNTFLEAQGLVSGIDEPNGLSFVRKD